MQTKIRLAETGDADDIYQIENLSFENPWSKNSLINLIEKDKLSEILQCNVVEISALNNRNID